MRKMRQCKKCAENMTKWKRKEIKMSKRRKKTNGGKWDNVTIGKLTKRQIWGKWDSVRNVQKIWQNEKEKK